MTDAKDPSVKGDEVPEEHTPGANGVDITPTQDGGVLKEIKREGSVDGHPMTGDKVFVHYVGTLTDGTKFDSSRDRGDLFEFTLGKGQVIKAWDIGVASMKKGELAVLTCKSEYAYGENGSPPKIPPNATLVFEVELFEWKGEDLSPDKDEGILRSQIDKGTGYQSPNDGATCEIHIIGKHKGTVFEDRDVKFVLGEGSENGIVEGVDIAMKKFKKGEVSLLTVKSQYGYGSEGNKELGIPGDADLEYEVKLIEFEKGKESWEMNGTEKLEQSDLAKQKGTDLFKQGKYSLAERQYQKILTYLEQEEALEGEEADKRKALLLAGHLNLAMCYLKLQDDFSAREQCNKALEQDPDNEKGLFRRGTANLNVQEYEDAISDFKRVIEIDPKNKAAKNQLVVTQAKLKNMKEKEKQTYAGMFQRFADIDAKREKAEKINEASTANSKQEPVENGMGNHTSSPSEEEEQSKMETSSPEQADAKVEVEAANA